MSKNNNLGTMVLDFDTGYFGLVIHSFLFGFVGAGDNSHFQIDIPDRVVDTLLSLLIDCVVFGGQHGQNRQTGT